jgi:diacylglycerol kinase (ATP)
MLHVLRSVEPARFASPTLVVIVNRGARGADGAPWMRIADTLRGHGLAPTFHFPRSPDEAAWIARHVARARPAAIVAAGGDGTINTVVNAVAGIGVPLAILPLGTANDLARELGVPLDAEAAVRRMADGVERRIDLLRVNGRSFCTVGGLGLPASCALGVERFRTPVRMMRRALGLLGARVYPLVAAATVLTRRGPRRLRITYRDPAGNEQHLDTAAHGIFIANQRALGAGLVLPTGSTNADGVFELCLVRAVPRAHLLAALACLKLGRPTPLDVFTVCTATRAWIACDREEIFFGDGDHLVRGRHFDVRIRPRALRVLC